MAVLKPEGSHCSKEIMIEPTWNGGTCPTGTSQGLKKQFWYLLVCLTSEGPQQELLWQEIFDNQLYG